MKAIAWIVTFLYIVVALFVWMCPVKGYCPDRFENMNLFSKATEKPVSLPDQKSSLTATEGLNYDWGSTEPKEDSSARNRIVRALKSNASGKEFVGITGLSHSLEPVGLDVALNLGLSRGRIIRQFLMSRGFDSSHIITTFASIPDSLIVDNHLLSPAVEVRLLSEDQNWLDNNHSANNVFRFNSNNQNLQLGDAQSRYIEQVIISLMHNPQKNILLTGHTSSEGTTDENQAKGREMAEALKLWLVQFGTPADRISVTSRGEADLVKKPEKTESDRNLNRRVVLTFVN